MLHGTSPKRGWLRHPLGSTPGPSQHSKAPLAKPKQSSPVRRAPRWPEHDMGSLSSGGAQQSLFTSMQWFFEHCIAGAGISKRGVAAGTSTYSP